MLHPRPANLQLAGILPRPLRPENRLQLFSLMLGVLLWVLAPVRSAHAEEAWKKVSEEKGLTIYERDHPGSLLREFKATGVIAAEPEVVRRVLDDVEAYPSFVPYVAEARNLTRDGSSRVSYQRISPPFVGDRDYTVRVNYECSRARSGTVNIRYSWKAANELGPAEKPGVARVRNTEGYWLLQGTANGQQTHATYCVISDGGGGLPAFVTNWASKTAMPKLFAAIRKQASLGKYQSGPR